MAGQGVKNMKIAITGGTGFVGRHLAQFLISLGHQPVLLARGRDRRHAPVAPLIPTDLSHPASLAEAIRGCEAIAHCAGINRETGAQTYQRIHIEGTRNLIEAARTAAVPRILMLSFLRARPGCGSPYHESKFQAEELIRQSGLDYTILKAGMIYGRGDHMLDHLSHTLFTLPLFATVGWGEQPIRPVAIDDMTRIITAALTAGRLSRRTAFVLGPETLLLSEAVRRVAATLNRRVLILPAPVVFHRHLAAVCERTMAIPLVARAQVQMLAEGFLEPAPAADALPHDLQPQLRFTPEQIRQGLPDPGPFTCADLRLSLCSHGG
jgi:NADH dehydrogenase